MGSHKKSGKRHPFNRRDMIPPPGEVLFLDLKRFGFHVFMDQNGVQKTRCNKCSRVLRSQTPQAAQDHAATH
jgi:hypothetical protein